MGVSKGNLCKALARVGNVESSLIAQKIAGDWSPRNLSLAEILDPVDQEERFCKPFPFCLAHPLQEDVKKLGDVGDWQVEWKWDGIRAQLINRAGSGMIWSRGDESVGHSFPEILKLVNGYPETFVWMGKSWLGGKRVYDLFPTTKRAWTKRARANYLKA